MTSQLVQRLADENVVASFNFGDLKTDQKRELASQTGIDAVVQLLKQQIEQPVHTLHLCRILRDISSFQPDTPQKLVNAQAPSLLVHGLAQHAQNADATLFICGLLQTLCANKAQQETLAQLSTPQILLQLLEEYKQPPQPGNVCIAASKVLALLCQDNTEVVSVVLQNNGIVTLLDVMEHHVANEAVVCTLMNNLTAVAWTEENLTTIGNEGGMDIVLSAMRQYKLSETTVLACFTCLSFLAHSAVIRQIVEEDGGLETVIEVLLEHVGNDKIMQKALQSVGSFTLSDKLREVAGGCNGVLVVLNAMVNSKDADTIKVGLWALSNLLHQNPENQQMLTTESGIGMLSQLLQGSVADVATTILKIVVTTSSKNPNVQMTLIQSRLIEHTVQAMNAHSKDDELHKTGSALFVSLTSTNHRKEEVIAGLQTPTIIAAMFNSVRHHLSHKAIVERCMFSLSQLLTRDVDREMASQVTNMSSILGQALQTYLPDQQVVSHVYKVILQLAETGISRELLVTEGLVGNIATAYSDNVNTENIPEKLLALILTLFGNHPDEWPQVPEDEATASQFIAMIRPLLEQLFASCKKFLKSARHQELLIAIICKLSGAISTCQELRDIAYQPENLSVILKSLTLHIKVENVVLHACWALEKFVFDPETPEIVSARLGQHHCVKTMKIVLQHWGSEDNIMCKALEVLSNIAEDDQLLNLFVTECSLDFLVQFMRDHVHHSTIQETLSFILGKLAVENGHEIAKFGGLEAMLDALEQHINSHNGTEVMHYSWIALEKLCTSSPKLSTSPAVSQRIINNATGGLINDEVRTACTSAFWAYLKNEEIAKLDTGVFSVVEMIMQLIPPDGALPDVAAQLVAPLSIIAYCTTPIQGGTIGTDALDSSQTQLIRSIAGDSKFIGYLQSVLQSPTQLGRTSDGMVAKALSLMAKIAGNIAANSEGSRQQLISGRVEHALCALILIVTHTEARVAVAYAAAALQLSSNCQQLPGNADIQKAVAEAVKVEGNAIGYAESCLLTPHQLHICQFPKNPQQQQQQQQSPPQQQPQQQEQPLPQQAVPATPPQTTVAAAPVVVSSPIAPLGSTKPLLGSTTTTALTPLTKQSPSQQITEKEKEKTGTGKGKKKGEKAAANVAGLQAKIAEIADLQQQLTEKTQQTEETQEKLSDLQIDYNNLQAIHTELEAQNEKQSTRLSELEKEVAQNKQKLERRTPVQCQTDVGMLSFAGLDEMTETLQRELREVEQQREELIKLQSSVEEGLFTRTAKLDSKEKRVYKKHKQKMKQVDELQKTHTAQLQQKEAELTHMERMIQEKQALEGTLSSRGAVLSAKINEIEEKESKLKKSMKEFDETMEAKKNQVDNEICEKKKKTDEELNQREASVSTREIQMKEKEDKHGQLDTRQAQMELRQKEVEELVARNQTEMEKAKIKHDKWIKKREQELEAAMEEKELIVVKRENKVAAREEEMDTKEQQEGKLVDREVIVQKKEAELKAREDSVERTLATISTREIDITEREEKEGKVIAREQKVGVRETELADRQENVTTQENIVTKRELAMKEKEDQEGLVSDREVKVAAREENVGDLEADLEAKELVVNNREKQVKTQEVELLELQTKLTAMDEDLKTREAVVEEKDSNMGNREQQVEQRTEELRKRDVSLIEAEEDLVSRQNILKVNEDGYKERLAKLETTESEYSQREQLVKANEAASAQKEQQLKEREDLVTQALKNIDEKESAYREKSEQLRIKLRDMEAHEKDLQTKEVDLVEREATYKRQSTTLEVKSKDVIARERKIEEGMNEVNWREKAVAHKEKEYDQREKDLEKRDHDMKEKEKHMYEKSQEIDTRLKSVTQRDKELHMKDKDVERREIATKDRQKKCEHKEEELQKRMHEVAGREHECFLKEEKLHGQETKLNQQIVDLAQREMDLQQKAENVDASRRELQKREVEVKGREHAHKNKKKEIDEKVKDIEQRERALVEWLKELEWRECDFEEREAANERPLAEMKSKLKRQKFNESLLTVQLTRMKDNYISSKERMLRQRNLPDLKHRKEFITEVSDMNTLKTLHIEVKEKSTQFRRIMAKLRGLEVESDDDYLTTEGDEKIPIKDAFNTKEIKDLKLISTRERELREEASFMQQIHQCPMNHRHKFVKDVELVVALEQWWLEARGKVFDRHMRTLKERLLHLKNAFNILQPKREEFPKLFTERAVNLTNRSKTKFGNLFTASFPAADLRPFDTHPRPVSVTALGATAPAALANFGNSAPLSPYKHVERGITLPKKANVRSRTEHQLRRHSPKSLRTKRDFPDRADSAPAGQQGQVNEGSEEKGLLPMPMISDRSNNSGKQTSRSSKTSASQKSRTSKNDSDASDEHSQRTSHTGSTNGSSKYSSYASSRTSTTRSSSPSQNSSDSYSDSDSA